MTKIRPCPTLIKAALKNPKPPELVSIYSDLFAHVPASSQLITGNLLPQWNTYLMSDSFPEVQSKILDLLVHMVDRTKPTEPTTDPMPVLFQNQTIVRAIFVPLGHLDSRAVQLIRTMIIRGNAQGIISYMKENRDYIISLVDPIAKSGNEAAIDLLRDLTFMDETVTGFLVPPIKVHLLRFPVTVAVDFMVASAELSTVIPRDTIESWLLSFDSFNILDLRQLLTGSFCSHLWNKPSAIKLLNRSAVPEFLKSVGWIHDQPEQTCEVDAEDATLASDTVLRTAGGSQGLDAFRFVRLYILSLLNSRSLPPETVETVFKLVKDPCEWISGAAVQLIFIWMEKYGMDVGTDFVFVMTSVIVAKGKSKDVVSLYQAMLHLLAVRHRVALAILMAEPKMRFKRLPDWWLDQPWVFPSLKRSVDKLPDLAIADYCEATRILGYAAEFLAVDDMRHCED
jgi:hypothetical protein